MVLLGTVWIFGCSGSSTADAVGTTGENILLDGNSSPLACADPTIFSENGRENRWFVFCTGMRHVWTTTDWKSFQNERPSLVFDFGTMPAASKQTDAWWAPTVTYDGAEGRYVLWVSVIDGRSSRGDTRSLAVFKASAPLGPWSYAGMGHSATADGQMIIDPMIMPDANGHHYLYWKQYGGGLPSRLMGARLGPLLTRFDGLPVELLNGFDTSSWEGNCRENPAVWEDANDRKWHMLYSGAYWAGGGYATGHAVSECGPLCTDPGRGWRIEASTNRGVPQVVQAKGDANFQFGGPGGAVWGGRRGEWIVYAAAARSAKGDHTRYLLKDNLRWERGAPFVDTAEHRPTGL